MNLPFGAKVMPPNPQSGVHQRRGLWGAMCGTLLAVAVGFALDEAALASIGDSFISIPGSAGHYKGKDHANWIRAEANQWSNEIRRVIGGANTALGSVPAAPAARVDRDRLMGSSSAPTGARPGSSGTLTVMIGRNNPDAVLLMDRCTKKAIIPELTYSESSGRGNPSGVPAFWKYKLKRVVIADCPVVEDAIDQAFVLAFEDVEWLNHDPNRSVTTSISQPYFPDVRPIEPIDDKKAVKSFVITWIAIATDVAEDQCPNMNAKPIEADVYRYMSKEEVAAIKAKNGEKGLTAGPETEARGPNKLNAVLLPGIVPDPGIHEPQSSLAYGIDLDGDDGDGAPPPGIRKHKNYVSPDGRTGIDNQLYRVMGCIPGYRGKRGYRNQTDNARRADGNITTVVEISGIDNEKNDTSVEVALIHSMDKPIRDNAGSKFIANYTFRPTEDPGFARYNIRVRGRIVNGVVMTDSIPKYSFYSGQGPAYELINARMRFEPQADGGMKGYLAGYQDWKFYANYRASGYAEGLFGYQQPAVYYALKRNADGMYDPATGEYNGISTVYEIDTVPAFLTSAPPKPLKVARDDTAVSKSQ